MRHDQIPRSLDDWIGSFQKRVELLERAKRDLSGAGGGGGGGGSVTSVTAGDATITVAGTATDPTVAVNAIPESKVTNLITDLSGKASTTHTHPESDVTGLTADLALLAPLASPTFTGTAAAPTVAGTTDSTTKIATTAFVQGVAALKADLSSPTFTGDPKAPTPLTADNDTSLATTAFVKAVVASYAPLASPTFTGDPKAPTPTIGDNDTSIATTAFVATAVAASGGGTVTSVTAGDSTITIGGSGTAPTVAVNAITESKVTNLVTDLAAKAALSSPVFTGNPTAPTPAAGDNDTSVATTAFVQSEQRPRTAVFKVSGTLSIGVGVTRLYNDTGSTWTIIAVRASVETPPSGGSVVVDVNKNGITIFTTQANRPTVTTLGTTSGKVTNADITSVADGDYLTIDVDTTTAPAAELSVQIVVR
jgi:hypothetical protein